MATDSKVERGGGGRGEEEERRRGGERRRGEEEGGEERCVAMTPYQGQAAHLPGGRSGVEVVHSGEGAAEDHAD